MIILNFIQIVSIIISVTCVIIGSLNIDNIIGKVCLITGIVAFIITLIALVVLTILVYIALRGT